MSRLIRLSALLLGLLWVCLSLLAGSVQAREEVWEEEMQFEARNQVNALIKALDTTHELREPFMRDLLKIAQGKQKQMVMQQLRLELQVSHSQVTEGIIEVFTRLNDPVILPTLEEELLFNESLDVRVGIIEHLPLFCVVASKDRQDLLQFIESGQRNLPRPLVAALRAPPINSTTGRYDLSLDEDVRGRVEKALTAQLDPVEAIIQNGLEQRSQDRALAMLKQMLAVDLGHTRAAWLEYWKSRGQNFRSPMQSEILDTQIAACRMLGYLGAEGRPELVERLRWLLSTPYNTARHSALDMLRELVDFWMEQTPGMEQALLAPNLRQPEEIWIKRRQEGARRLLEVTLELAATYAGDPDPAIRMVLVDCLGATASPAAAEPIARAFRADGQSPQMRAHVIQALGNVSGIEAERLLEQMAVFRGISVDKEQQIDEYRRVRLALESLGKVAGRVEQGRLRSRDAAASDKAFAFLIGQLADARRLPGAPSHVDPERQTVRFMVREVLQQSLQEVSERYDADFWREAWKKVASSR